MIERNTKYKNEVLAIVNIRGHATNAEIAHELRKTYPDVSDTTVHRLTSRLLERGYVAYAPSTNDGSSRFDFNTIDHDHFVCTGCNGLRDIHVAEELIPTIQKALGGCKITGRLVIHGTCETCAKGEQI